MWIQRCPSGQIKPYLRRRRGYLLFIGAASAQAALYSSDAPRPQRAARHQACYLRIPRGPRRQRTQRRSHCSLTKGHYRAFFAAWVLAGWSPPKKLTNACFEGSSVNTFCAARRLSLPPPCTGNAATLPLRGPWMYVVGYSPGVLGPSTYSTALCSSLRPYLDLFARGSRSECFALCLSLSA